MQYGSAGAVPSSSAWPSAGITDDDDLLAADLCSFEIESSRDRDLMMMANVLKGVLPPAPLHAHSQAPPTVPEEFALHSSAHPSSSIHHSQSGTRSASSAAQVQQPATWLWPREQQQQQNSIPRRPGPPAPSSSYIGSPPGAAWPAFQPSTNYCAQQQQPQPATPYGTPMAHYTTLPGPGNNESSVSSSSSSGMYGTSPVTNSAPGGQTRYTLRSSTRQAATATATAAPQQYYYSTSPSGGTGLWSSGLRAPAASRERNNQPHRLRTGSVSDYGDGRNAAAAVADDDDDAMMDESDLSNGSIAGRPTWPTA